MIESNPLGRIVRPILKIVFILGALCMIILPMLGTSGASLQTYGASSWVLSAQCSVSSSPPRSASQSARW